MSHSTRFARLAAGPLLAAALFAPAPVQGQSFGQLMSVLRDGGGWVQVPIAAGQGSFSTSTLPVAAMSIEGCVNVWYGHSGSWTIEAIDNVLGTKLNMDAEPGVGVPFDHDFGMTTQVDFDFTWSEARDTTLYLWVGLDVDGEGGESTCEPPPSEG